VLLHRQLVFHALQVVSVCIEAKQVSGPIAILATSVILARLILIRTDVQLVLTVLEALQRIHYAQLATISLTKSKPRARSAQPVSSAQGLAWLCQRYVLLDSSVVLESMEVQRLLPSVQKEPFRIVPV
jgi:hypothetical protein